MKHFRKILSFLTILCLLEGRMASVSASGTGTPHITFTNELSDSPDLRVMKKVEVNPLTPGAQVPEGAKFRFALKLDGEIASNVTYTLCDRSGEIIKKSGNREVPFMTDDGGIFELEDGQTATFQRVGKVSYEVTEDRDYLYPRKDTEGSGGFVIETDGKKAGIYYRRVLKNGNNGTEAMETELHPEYKYETRAMSKYGYTPLSFGYGGSVTPGMGAIVFKNQYTPKETVSTELRVTKTISYPGEYALPQEIKDTRFWFHLEITDNRKKEYTVENPVNALADDMRLTDSDGDFYLYPGETAIFANVDPEEGYRVEEIMQAPGTGDDQAKGCPVGWWPTGATRREGGNIPASAVCFNNSNTSFRINKFMDGDIEPDNPEFTFQLLDAQSNPMGGATYYRYDILSYDMIIPSEEQRAGTQEPGTDMRRPTAPVTQKWKTDDKGYFRLRANEEAVFCGIWPGTSYTVKEIGRLYEKEGMIKIDASYARQPSRSGTVDGTGIETKWDFVNSRIDVDGALTVSKHVENETSEGSGTSPDFHFLLYKRLKTTADVKEELKKWNVAVYDDTDLNAEIGKILVEAAGWKPVEAASGSGEGAQGMGWHYVSGDGKSYEIYVPVNKALYTVSLGDAEENYETGAEDKGWEKGEFVIKEGQTAKFATLSVGGQYLVEEVKFTQEYSPAPARAFPLGHTATQVVDGTTQKVTRGPDGTYEYIQTAVMPKEGLGFTFTNLYKPKKTDITIHKVDDKGMALPGAQFKLYRDSGKGQEVESIPETRGATVTFSDLKTGTYWLYEEKAPSGYRLLPDPVEIRISSVQTGLEITVDGKKYEPGIEVEVNDSDILKKVKISAGSTDAHGIDVNGTVSLTISNSWLYELPSSGGMGIYRYLIGGILLMTAASLIFYKKHRREVVED